MNLGSFAGGAVQGYQAGVRQNMQQQDQAFQQNMQQRRMVMAEQDQAAQQEQRSREAEFRTESAKLWNQFYGEREEQIGESTSVDGQGGEARVPTVRKTQVMPGTNRDTDAKWHAASLALQAKYSKVDPVAVEQMAKRLDDLRRTEVGRMLDKIAMGDSESMGALLKKLGKDPEGAKHEFRPIDGINHIVLATGEKLDLKKYAAAHATVEYANRLRQEEKDAVTAEHTKAQTRNLGASAALNEARAKAEPAESAALIRQRDASAAASRARAAANAGGAGGTAKGAGKELQAAVKMVTEKGMDGKADPASAAAMLAVAEHHLSSGKAKSPNQAASMAAAVVTKIRSEADKKIGELRRAGRKPAEFDGKSWDDVRNIAIQQRIAKQFGATPAATSTSADEGDDE